MKWADDLWYLIVWTLEEWFKGSLKTKGSLFSYIRPRCVWCSCHLLWKAALKFLDENVQVIKLGYFTSEELYVVFILAIVL